MKNWSLWTGLVLFGLMLFISFIGPQLSFIEHTPPEHRMRFYDGGEIGRAPFPPSKEDPLGTDREARDILSLIILGAKDTLKIIVLITLVRYVIAIPMAFLASTKKGIAYMVSNGWYSLFGSIPTIFAAILLLEIVPVGGLENGVDWKVVLIALIEVGRVSYIFAHEIYEVSQKEFVQASVTVGSTPFQLSVMHYLPSVSQSLVVNFFNDLARVTLLLGQLALFQYFIEHAIDYIPGGGVFQDESGYNSVTGLFDWPGLLSAARYEVIKAVWIPLFPAIALTLLLLTFQLLSEGFRRLFERRAASDKHGVVRRAVERIGEAFVASKMAGVVTLVVFVVAVGAFVVSGVKNGSKTSTVNVGEQAVLNAKDLYGDGKYMLVNNKVIATTVATTAKGGFYDKLHYIDFHMEKKSDRDYETDNLVLKCRTIGAGRCELPVFTFKEPVATVEEAYRLLADHLPTDAVIEKEFQDNESKYIYSLQSSLLEQSYTYVSIRGMTLIFHLTPEKTIEKVEMEGL